MRNWVWLFCVPRRLFGFDSVAFAETRDSYLMPSSQCRVSAQESQRLGWLAEFRRSGGVSAKGMTTIIQVEYRTTLLSIREEILQSLGRPILSVLGSKAARALDPADREIGVVVIGHGPHGASERNWLRISKALCRRLLLSCS